MGFSRATLGTLRIALVVALLAISHQAFADREMPLIDQMHDKLKHAAAFAMLAFLVDFSHPASRFGPAKILLLLGYGIGIEAVQHFLPRREASAWDVLANGAGIAAYMLSVPVLRRMRWFGLRWQQGTPP